MLTDAYGNRVTTACAETIAALDLYTAEWIGYGQRLREIFVAAEADPDCALINACVASVHMALETKTGFAAAEPYLNRMRRAAEGITDRERLIVAAVEAWSRGDTHGALAQYRNLAHGYPSDIAAAKWGQYHAFSRGDVPAMLMLAQDIMPAHSGTAEAWGMLAFALEQSHRVYQAEDAALHALSLKASEPWAHHALAHAYETTDRLTDGIHFLQSAAPSWHDRGLFIREHNWWHLAQLYLDRGDYGHALDIHDARLWGAWPEFPQEQIGAISSLWRLELNGVPIGPRWDAIAAKVIERGPEHLLPFQDIHFIYALARAGRSREADAFLQSLVRFATQATDRRWAKVALPAARGVLAHARGQNLTASELLFPVLEELQQLGGSHSQRDVIFYTWLSASLGSGADPLFPEVVNDRARVGSMQRFIRRLRDRGDHILYREAA